MSDIVVVPENGKNKIIHANKKKYSAEMIGAVDGGSIKSPHPRQAVKMLDTSSPASTKQELADGSSTADRSIILNLNEKDKVSGKAVGKSIDNGFSPKEHFKATENVLEIFKTAKFIESQTPINKSPDIIAFHKYLGGFENNDVKITIKELKENGNRFYSIELLEVSPKASQSSNPKINGFGDNGINHTGEELLSKNTSTPINPSTSNYTTSSRQSQVSELGKVDSAINKAIEKELGADISADIKACDVQKAKNIE